MSVDQLISDKETTMFGKTTSLKFQRMKILILGLESLGSEVARHILPLQPDTLTLCDENLISQQDLDCNAFLQQSNKTRSQSCLESLKSQLTTTTNIAISQFNINEYFDQLRKTKQKDLPKMLLAEIEKHDLILVCDILSKSLVIEISKVVRENQSHPKGLIWCLTAGLYGFIFDDFSASFKVYDRDGDQPFPYHIEHISNADPGVVKVIKEKPHNYQTGDFVCLHDVEGMIEVNGNEPRPIRVISPYEFSIEDTSSFSPYLKSGLVQMAKVPFRLCFPPIEEQINTPQIDHQRQLSAQATLISLINALEIDSAAPSKEAILEQAVKIFKKMLSDINMIRQQNVEMLSQKSDVVTMEFSEEQKMQLEIKFQEQLGVQIIDHFRYKLFPMVTFFGGLVSMEVIKFTGKVIFVHCLQASFCHFISNH